MLRGLIQASNYGYRLGSVILCGEVLEKRGSMVTRLSPKSKVEFKRLGAKRAWEKKRKGERQRGEQ